MTSGQWLACIARAKVFPYSKIITSGRKTGKKAVCIEDDSVTLHTYKVCEGALSNRHRGVRNFCVLFALSLIKIWSFDYN